MRVNLIPLSFQGFKWALDPVRDFALHTRDVCCMGAQFFFASPLFKNPRSAPEILIMYLNFHIFCMNSLTLYIGLGLTPHFISSLSLIIFLWECKNMHVTYIQILIYQNLNDGINIRHFSLNAILSVPIR